MLSDLKNNGSKFESVLHDIFEAGIFIKFFNSLWEIVSGFFILFLSKETIGRLFYFLARKEMLEDPRDFFINFSLKFLENLSHNTQVFIAVYILLHGLLNLFLVVQLYRDKIWAYVATVSIMVVFLFYQVYRIILHHSTILTIITIFDILFIMLTWHEYKRKKHSTGII